MTKSLAPWGSNTHRLWSLWDMKDWDGAGLTSAHQTIATWGQTMAIMQATNNEIQFDVEQAQIIFKSKLRP